MKYLLTISLLVFTFSLTAQHTFGLTGGTQLTGLHSRDNFNNFPEPQMGFRLGGLYEYELTEKLGLRTELSYSLAGGQNSNSEHLYLSYLSIPVQGVYKPVEKLRFYLGPELNILVNDHTTGPAYNSRDFKPLDFGISVGSEFRITQSFGVSIRNYFGLIHANELDTSDFPPIQEGDPIMNYEGRVFKFSRHNILQLSVSYYFKK